MAEAPQAPPALEPVSKPLSLIPVGIKEAALDSPTFRATSVHFGDQIDIIERWLESYIKSVGKLSQEINSLQPLVDNYIQAVTPPLQLSEAVLDHDYTVLALKRFGEGAREFWQAALRGLKRADSVVVEPIRTFLTNDLRMLKDARKNLEATQRTFDSAIARYAGQAKTKEPSSLREDAFQLHEARRAYLKASMDFCVMAPQVRGLLDKLLVKVMSEQWRDMKNARESNANSFSKWNIDIERVKGWSKEMENSERVFKRELHLARQQIENTADAENRPSRDLDVYGTSTVPYIGGQGANAASVASPAKPNPENEKAEKQGWLFQRTITGKPTRTYWVRRWFFVKNGIFGWLAQGARSGAVEESEKVGVLLCGIRPAFQEERRFCFDVKTKDTTILLQAETQNDLIEWISVFEVAKRKALEDTSREGNGGPQSDAAFSISPPIAPEFAAKTSEGHAHQLSDDLGPLERAETLAIPGLDVGRASIDVTRRGAPNFERDGESSSRDHAARIMQKLDLTRKSTSGAQLTGNSTASSAAGSIANLISASLASASQSFVPVNQYSAPAPGLPDARPQTVPISSLAPSTLVNPPAPTNLSKAAVAVTGERGLGLGKSGGMPGGLLANLWGSFNWGYINRLERGEIDSTEGSQASRPSSPSTKSPNLDGPEKSDDPSSGDTSPGRSRAGSVVHRKTVSLGGPTPSAASRPTIVTEDFPNYYPLPLRMQDAQFRTLFPNVPRKEKVVLVFRAVWNPTEQQEFPGRVYVTAKNVFFYSHHLGLVLITGISLTSIDEVTAAPGKDCDFLFLHFKSGVREDSATRITVKTFLEPLKLLQRRLNFLVRCASSDGVSLEYILKNLIKMEVGDSDHSPGAESWEDVDASTPMDPSYGGKEVKASLRIDGNLYGPSGPTLAKAVTKFKLPSHPVIYTPQGMGQAVAEKEYDVTAKALFHVLFGDKSAVFQMLYRERWAQRVVQGPWVQAEGGLQRRDFEYEVAQNGADAIVINDHQIIEQLNDHLCYVVTHRTTPWYLPSNDQFTLVTKIVVTHVAKSRCKLAIFTRVDWSKPPKLGRGLIERQGLQDLELEAQDLVDVVNDQVAKLGHNNRTSRVVQIFGQIGQHDQAAQFAVTDIPPPNRPRKFKLQPRTFTSFVWQFIGNVIISVLSTVFSWTMGGIAGAARFISVHKLLFVLLILSSGANLFFSSRDSYRWWNERSAVKFMTKLGVGPGTSMTRTVYLKDLEDRFLNANLTIAGFPTAVEPEANKCHQGFATVLSSDISASPMSQIPPTSRRLQRTRKNLGTRRHDLLVALRVVNRIEKEVIDAEYENWLLDETQKCQRVGAMLMDSKKSNEEGAAHAKDVEAWLKTYCGDCSKALDEARHRAGGLA